MEISARSEEVEDELETSQLCLVMESRNTYCLNKVKEHEALYAEKLFEGALRLHNARCAPIE